MRRKAGRSVLSPDVTRRILRTLRLRQIKLERQNEALREELRELQRRNKPSPSPSVTEESLKMRMAELEVAWQRAENAHQAKTTFLSIMSHELRGPLHTILGYTRLVAKDLRRHGGTGPAVEKLAIVERSGTQLLQLIDEVLAVSRGSPEAVVLLPEVASLHALIDELDASGKLLAVPGHNQFRIVLAEGVVDWVEVDPLRLMRVLHNLVANACKYTEYGAVTLRIDALPELAAPPPAVAQAFSNIPSNDPAPPVAAQSTCRLRFEVEDNGCGIAAQDLQRIFEPFNRLPGTEHQPGVGLGLPIARQWVRAMGGDIELQSTPGQGSRFFFTLSLPQRIPPIPTQAPPHWSTSINGHAGVQRSVLVVDDNADNRQLLRTLCRRWGFRVVVATESAEALAVCLRTPPSIDAVLIDRFTPKIGGWDFLRALREHRHLACLPVTLISTVSANRPADFPDGINFDAVLMKPIAPDALANILRQQLDLVWLLDDAHTGREADLAPMADKTRPPDALLEEFARRLESGEVLAIERWARRLAVTHPEFSSYTQQVERCCRQVNLAGLSRLLKGSWA